MNLVDLVDLVDTNLTGLAFRNSKLSPAVFVAGFLQEIIQSESFRAELPLWLQEKLLHLSFLVHLMVRLEDTQLVSQEFQQVQTDLESGAASWEDSQYFRAWEARVWSRIFFQPGETGGLKTDPGVGEEQEEQELSFVLENVKTQLSDPSLVLDRLKSSPTKLEMTEMIATETEESQEEEEVEADLTETDFSCGLCHLKASSREELLLHVKTSHPTEAVSITQFTKAVARKAGKRKSGNINTCDICKVRERERKRVLDWRVCLTLKYCHFSGQFLSAQVV